MVAQKQKQATSDRMEIAIPRHEALRLVNHKRSYAHQLLQVADPDATIRVTLWDDEEKAVQDNLKSRFEHLKLLLHDRHIPENDTMVFTFQCRGLTAYLLIFPLSARHKTVLVFRHQDDSMLYHKIGWYLAKYLNTDIVLPPRFGQHDTSRPEYLHLAELQEPLNAVVVPLPNDEMVPNLAWSQHPDRSGKHRGFMLAEYLRKMLFGVKTLSGYAVNANKDDRTKWLFLPIISYFFPEVVASWGLPESNGYQCALIHQESKEWAVMDWVPTIVDGDRKVNIVSSSENVNKRVLQHLSHVYLSTDSTERLDDTATEVFQNIESLIKLPLIHVELVRFFRR